ncbi:hypothetical protein [Pseudomonas nicosulfuronedens]
MAEQSLRSNYACVVGGAGPAGMGFLFNAYKTGALADLARDGLLVVDAALAVGRGRLGDYHITANSVGDVFLDCLRDPALLPIFAPLAHSSAFRALQNDPHGAPMLTQVGELLAHASTLFMRYVTEHLGVEVALGTRIEKITAQDDGSFQLALRSGSHGVQVDAGSLVMNLGGRQNREYLNWSLAEQDLHLSHDGPTVYSSDALLSLNPAELVELFGDRVTPGSRFTVVGGSHSAFSILDNLACALDCLGLEQITLLHRAPIRLFFESVEEARAAGYRVDEGMDVCPVSGRVNRSGGLRYRAHQVGTDVLSNGVVSGTRVKVELLCLEDRSPAVRERLQQCCGEDGVMVQAIGYQPCLPALRRSNGEPLQVRESKGGLDSDAAGCLRDHTGRPIPGLYSFGLGSGLAANPMLGSERSFDSRIYGVWQFHHDASGRVIEAIQEHLAGRATQPAQPLDSGLDDAPFALSALG